jgi:lysophospholipase L1-like esterase
MKIQGERIIVFGDSLSHPGPDAGPSIVDITQGSNRGSSAPGDLLASRFLEGGAQAVRVDARVGRSARSFLLNEDSSSLLASDRAFRPTKVVIWLGTNDIDRGTDAAALAKTRDAMTQIRDAYRAMGAEVIAIGPPMFQDVKHNAGAPIMLDLMRGVFGADRTIDARPLTDPGPRSKDGIHFAASTAAGTARQLFNAVAAQGQPTVAPTTEPSSSSGLRSFLLGFAAIAGVGGLTWLIWRASRRGEHALARRRRRNLGAVDERLINRVAQALSYKVPVTEIHDQLIDEGYSEDDVYLAYKAAKQYLKHVQEPLPEWIAPDPETTP